ncbi:MAG: hypothetical protein GY913_25035 [Proteobacteria bacterium]|nr:hypothetical protein [Pseudomonadota bacterium]MCP4920180.1 hypothetical protein [Pseudomonadota bacterium]
MTLLLLVSCWLRQGEGRDPVEGALTRADRVYAERADVERLDESIEMYRELLAEHSDDPRVLAALSRAWGARAFGHPGSDQAELYDRARSHGVACMALNPGYASRVRLAAGRITEGAVKQLGEPELDCIEATVFAWARWIELRGPAAGIDLEPLRFLARHARLLGDSWVGPWGEAMTLVLVEGPVDRELPRSRALFELAIKSEPQLAIAHLDLARHQLVLEGDRKAYAREMREFSVAHPATADGEWAMENHATREAVTGMDGDVAWARSWGEPDKEQEKPGP